MRPCLGSHLQCLLRPTRTLALKEGGDVTDTHLFASESLIIRYDKMVSHRSLRAMTNSKLHVIVSNASLVEKDNKRTL
jgi:hypothetical protein